MPSDLKICIITEGGHAFGFGHVMRCISIFQAFNEIHHVPRFVINADSTIDSIIPSEIPFEKINWIQDSSNFLKSIAGYDIVFVDSYHADLLFYQKLTQQVVCPVYIDDNNRLEYPRGITVNAMIYAHHLYNIINPERHFILGPKYMYLRREFWSIKPKIIQPSLSNIMIILGGTDIHEITLSLIHFISEKYPEIKIQAIIGNGFTNIDQYKTLKIPNLELKFNLDAKGIIAAISQVDLVISACGQTLYELGLFGCPTIGIGVAENQKLNIQGWIESGFLTYAGYWDDTDLYSNLKKGIDNLFSFENRKKKQEMIHNTVSGNGSYHLVQKVLDFYELYRMNLSIRKVQESDCNLIYEWANDPVTRNNSFNSNPIPLADHIQWFHKKIASKTSYFFVLLDKSIPVGQIRIEEEPDKTGIISFSVGPNYRGKGYGTALLRYIILIMPSYSQLITVLIGKVKKTNIGSQKAFEKAKFDKFEHEDYYEYHYSLD